MMRESSPGTAEAVEAVVASGLTSIGDLSFLDRSPMANSGAQAFATNVLPSETFDMTLPNWGV
jgi:hypothetical protein